MSNRYLVWRKIVACTVAYILAFGQIIPAAYAVNTDISDVPLVVKNQVRPNVMMTLDDSGSMQWEFLPEDAMGFSMFMYPRPDSPYNGSTYLAQVPNYEPNNTHNFYGRSAYNNKLYYNPDVEYRPWSKADGSEWAQASVTAAYYNPANTSAGTLNLLQKKTETAFWFSDYDFKNKKYTGSLSYADCDPQPCFSNYAYWPVTYFKYKGGDVLKAASYDRIEITSSTPASATYSYNGVDANGNPVPKTRTRAQELQNFANWFQYHRSRVSAARAGIGRAFSRLDETVRVGFASINSPSATIDGVSSPGSIKAGVRAFTGTDRTSFFSTLYNLTISTSSTPLRESMDDVAQYFKRTDNQGPWSANPGPGSNATQLACRRNYNILMTDGYWNDDAARTAAARANVDNTAGTVYTPVSPDLKAFGYTPGAPWKDNWSNTLADVAMYYWATDLRSDLPNNVPVSAGDNAFWQHITVYGVALGVFGTVTKTQIEDAYFAPYPTIDWPDPSASNPAKIDDLAHAAINSRGAFYSAADPVQLTNSLAAALSAINAIESSGSAIAVSSANVITGDNLLFSASYLSGFTWSGDLEARSVTPDTGLVDTLKETRLWSAQEKLVKALQPLQSLPPGSDRTSVRRIVTHTGLGGQNQGIPFRYSKLTSAQQGALKTPVSPPGLADAAAVVEYLRGDQSGEQDNYRARNSLILGPIVNSQPVVIRPPQSNYVDAGYAAFKTTAAIQNRRQIVVVGANDGMLHAFDAGKKGTSDSGSGDEVWAYVPSFVIPNLNNLSRRDGYTYKVYVDATPVTADIDFSNTKGKLDANGKPTETPDWRTIVVGGLGKGGRGFYALDVTNTLATDSEDDVAKKVLWEFPNAGTSATVVPNIGYSFGKPYIVKVRGYGWVVLVTSGYNNGTGDTNGTGQGYLYVLDARTGSLLATLGTGAGTAATPSGLTYIAPYVESADIENTVDYVYAGDLEGSVWRFDLRDASKPAVQKLAALVDGSGNAQPITSEPELSKVRVNNVDRRFVYVGTGLLLGDKDIPGVPGANASATRTQTIYGLVDDLSVKATPSTAVISPLRSNLQQQSITDKNTVRYGSSNTVDLAVKKGWFVDLPVTGERIDTNPSLAAGVLTLVSNVPSSDPCTLGGYSYTNMFDYKTGGGITALGGLVSIKHGTLANTAVTVRTTTGQFVTFASARGGSKWYRDEGTKSVTTSTVKRRSWRELLR